MQNSILINPEILLVEQKIESYCKRMKAIFGIFQTSIFPICGNLTLTSI